MKKPLLMDLEDNVYPRGRCARHHRPPQAPPARSSACDCPDYEAVARAIEEMAVQGAGDIAVTAGFGLYLAARKLERGSTAGKTATLREAANRLIATRPTGFHLAALVNKLMSRIEEAADAKPASEVIMASLRRALESQRRISEDTGRHAETLLSSGDRILTHCFAGPALLYMLSSPAKTARTCG